MWRRCDLHRHTTPDTAGAFTFDAQTFLQECVDDGLDVVAVTDHDRLDHVHAVTGEAANYGVLVVPGIRRAIPGPPGPRGRGERRLAVARRLNIRAEGLDYDRGRLREWGVAHAVLSACWSAEDGAHGWERAIATAEALLRV